jgi:hypothetical protein
MKPNGDFPAGFNKNGLKRLIRLMGGGLKELPFVDKKKATHP